nr:beta-N-acetylglucosaminidase domain-containing protein [Motilibacter deserti]
MDVIPRPQSAVATGGSATLPAVVGLVAAPSADPAALAQLKDLLGRQGVSTRDGAMTGRDGVTFYLDGPGAGAALQRMGTQGPAGLPSGGYVLASGRDGKGWSVVLAGVDADGTFHAVQTLEQLLPAAAGTTRTRLRGVTIRDWPGFGTRGVIEGFYGAPWSPEDRLRQLEAYGDLKLGTYVYAPKDDPYHRERWRDPYPSDQLAQLGQLVTTARDNHVDLVFAVSPGQSICYTSEADISALYAKAEAVYGLGVRDFALFFDDISTSLNCASDQQRFGADASPAAAAQAYLLDRFQREFLAAHAGSGPLQTVPTEYSGLGASAYKSRFAALVPAGVNVYWTGSDVVAPTVTAAQTQQARTLYGSHPLLLWDNYPVNDYSEDRLYLGPLVGRAPDLPAAGLDGVIANPMVQAEPSLLPLATTADYAWNPAAYDPDASQARAARYLAGDAADALLTFADVNRSSPLGQAEAPRLATLIAAFEAELDAGTLTSSTTRRLEDAFEELQKAPGILRENAQTQRFAEQADLWLREAEALGRAGAAAAGSLYAQSRGHETSAWNDRAALEEALAESIELRPTVGYGVLDTFLRRAQQASTVVTLSSPAAGTTLTPGSDVVLTAGIASGSAGVAAVRFYVGGRLVGTATGAPWQVTWTDVPRGVAQVVVEAEDASGRRIASTPVDLTVGVPDRALLLIGMDAPTSNPEGTVGEQAVVSRLARLGLATDIRIAASTTTADANGYSLIVVSSTVASSAVGTKFRDLAIPVVAWEAFVFDDFRMTTNQGEEFRQQTIDVVPGTPLSAGLSGTVAVYRAPGRIRWGVVGPGAVVAATYTGIPTRATLFGYAAGAPLVDGSPAPAARVGMFLGDEALDPGLANDATLALFDRSVTWALGR